MAGKYIVGHNARNEAIGLCWSGRNNSRVDRTVLRAMFEEAKALRLKKPLRVYGTTCTVGETESFRFLQIPDEILAALQLADEEAATEDESAGAALVTLDGVAQEARLAAQRGTW